MDSAVTRAIPHLRDTAGHRLNPDSASIRMNPSKSPKPEFDPQEWDRRKAANRRLGLIVSLIVLLIFFGTLWKYRPL